MLTGDALDQLAKQTCAKVQGLAGKVSTEALMTEFIRKQSTFSERICKHGLPEPPKPKVKKSEAEKLAIKRAARKRRKQRKVELERQVQEVPEQDDNFFFIAGYTSGGAPYGVTWAEMGLEPWESLENDIYDVSET